MVCSEPGGQRPVLSLSLDLIKDAWGHGTAGLFVTGYRCQIQRLKVRLPGSVTGYVARI